MVLVMSLFQCVSATCSDHIGYALSQGKAKKIILRVELIIYQVGRSENQVARPRSGRSGKATRLSSGSGYHREHRTGQLPRCNAIQHTACEEATASYLECIHANGVPCLHTYGRVWWQLRSAQYYTCRRREHGKKASIVSPDWASFSGDKGPRVERSSPHVIVRSYDFPGRARKEV
ncbi:hypothetical protein F5B20DRAFT_54406 [Whalleya microplaca]|nr:hypothetical protein F5B20DRAFT_54406 [Whalleya microplaca]